MENPGRWFYQVKERIKVNGSENNPAGENEFVKNFTGADLKDLRHQAIRYFNKQGVDLKNKYAQFYTSDNDPSLNDIYTSGIYFVQWFDKDNFVEYVIASDDQEENANGLDAEAIVWKEFGLEPPPQMVGLPDEDGI